MTTHLLRSRPAPTADPELGTNPLLEVQVNQTDDGLGDEWAGDIRRMLCPWVTSHRGSVDAMADLLAMDRPTFDRRLKSRGTSYRALADEIRFEVACRLLKDTEMSLSQIAAALGYSEASAFTRAFRGWSGQAPSVWRAAH
ncbi:helix-turn-helix domain-containing protein [Microvirga tunisiensis]|uniref:helix-turn-helix domain-containing protein n=1 Tax=Microvirga tunisiensis TaxID=2108360 RepID=UPI00128E4A18|nr:AraC family transcriptional regulator [Microvirga tunisiensis]MPR09338.1 helix-turn-helix transcriptional regulator [Microvirga tunisiensis]